MQNTSRDSGDLLDHCSLALREADGKLLGTGILVDEKWILTCAHVVESVERLEVLDGLSLGVLSLGTVRERKSSEPDDLALVELDSPLPNRGQIRFEEWERGEKFHAVGYPKAKRQIRGEVLSFSDNKKRLQCDVEGSGRTQRGFSGGAVWALERKAAVGVITEFCKKTGNAFAITTEQIQGCFPQLFPGPKRDTKKHCRRFVRKVAQELENEEISDAILKTDSTGDWKAASADGSSVLAETLCLETKPEDLVTRLCQAFCDLDKEQGLGSAERVFEILTQAVPASVLSHWPLEWPEGSAKDVQIGLLNRVLAEFALAASEGGKASFHSKPAKPGSDEPRAVHEIPRPGELGPDLDGDEGARELAKELEKRLFLEEGETSNLQNNQNKFLARMAVRRPAPGVPRFVDGSDLEGMKHAQPDPKQPWRHLILDMINEELSERADGGERHFYLIAKDDEPLIKGLRKLLPQLKIVTLKAPRGQMLKTRKMLRQLREVFLRRRKLERPNI